MTMNNFGGDFNSGMRGDWISKVVPVIFAIAVVAIVAYWVAIGFIGYTAFNKLKDCTPALVQAERDGVKTTSIECKKPEDTTSK